MLKSKVIYELHFLQESKWLRMKQTIILNVLEGTMRTISTDQSISWVPGKKIRCMQTYMASEFQSQNSK